MSKLIFNFLTGSLALRSYKTGVHVVHDNLLKELEEHNYMGCNAKISCYCTKKEMEQEYPQYRKEKYSEKIIFSHKYVKFLMYFIPVEIFFGKSDIYFCDGIIPITLHKSKKVAIIHDLMVMKYPENYKLIKKLYLKYFYNRCKKADLIVTVSESTKKDVIQYLEIDRDKIKVVNCGIDTNKIKKTNMIGKTGNKIDFSEKYLLYIGDMRKNKNLINAIKGFECAKSKDAKLKFYIAGAKKFEYDKLKKYVSEHKLEKDVIFLGYVSDEEKEQLYSFAFALLFVSEYEGFGIPILEGAAYETPVITSNTSSMNEIAEGYCLTVNPYKKEDIGNEILKLNNAELRKKVIERQNKLLLKYTWDNSYKQFEEALKPLI